MVRSRTRSLTAAAVAALLLATLFAAQLSERPADADVTEVEGSAYAHMTFVGLFGGPPNNPDVLQGDPGPAPLVTLPPGGSATPITAQASDASVRYGPAEIFRASFEEVSTQGVPGPGGSVTSSARAEDINIEGDYFSAVGEGFAESTCTASEEGVSGSTTLNNALLTLATQGPVGGTGEPTNQVPVPANPEPNTPYAGTIDHVGDSFRMIINEQIIEGDKITVNAVHVFLGQNAAGEEVPGVARGEAIIGQSVCGVTSDGQGGPTTTQPGGGSTTTTQPGGGGSTTTTQPGGGGSTTTTQPGGGSTTTTQPDGGSTTTTQPDGGSTTTTQPDGGSTTTTQPDSGGGDCEEPTDFVGQLIFQIFRGIADLFESLGITGFEDFGCDLDD